MPTDVTEVLGPHHRKVFKRVLENANPFEQNKRTKLQSASQKSKARILPSQPKASTSSKPRERRSVEIEDVDDIDDHIKSIPPRNLKFILVSDDDESGIGDATNAVDLSADIPMESEPSGPSEPDTPAVSDQVYLRHKKRAPKHN
jgi:hypothetical protein